MHKPFAIIVQGLAVKKRSKIWMENTVICGNEQFQHGIFLAREKTNFQILKTESLYIWLKAKDIALSVLSNKPHFLNRKKFSIIVHLFKISY